MRFVESFTAATALAASFMLGRALPRNKLNPKFRKNTALDDIAATRRFVERLSKCTALQRVAMQAQYNSGIARAVDEYCVETIGLDSTELMAFVNDVVAGAGRMYEVEVEVEEGGEGRE